MEKLHQPVLLEEVVQALEPRKGQSYLDLTAGYGGHAQVVLDVTRNYKSSCLVDRDAQAIEFLRKLFASNSVRLVQQDFYSAALQEIECGNKYDLILADLGVSSPQLDEAGRGFAFRLAGPLDMRMDRRQTLSAEQLVNHWRARDLQEIFVKYGELSPRAAERVAQLMVHGRPWQDTKQLAEAVAAGLGRSGHVGHRASRGHGGGHGHGRVHPATRVFQALRIAVNDELGQVEQVLPLLPKLLNPGGRVAIITFHSLEDRLVKNYFREAAAQGAESELKILTKKPIVAENVELVINPRARSAKLRVAERI